VGVVGGGWFAENVVRRVGNGVDTLFLTDSWQGGVPLSVTYRHLFDLATNKSISVVDMCELGWEEGGASWQWRRQLWEEEEMLGECTSLLYDIVLQTNISDSWVWRHDIDGGYSVRGAYALLTRVDVANEVVVFNLIWHKLVPLKVSMLAWRLLRNRLPTKDNLVTHNIIFHEASLCVNGCCTLETTNHLSLVFCFCPFVEPGSILDMCCLS
jgi:hypothetical protein